MTSAVCPACRELVPTINSHHTDSGRYWCRPNWRPWGRSVLAAAALLVVVLSAVLSATPALAQDSQTVAEARSVFTAGQVAFDAGRYADALVYFRRSYSLSRRPELLFNIALCQDRLRNDDAATTAYTRYLAEMPSASNRAEVERRLAAMQLARERRAAEAAAAVDVSPERVASAGVAVTDSGDGAVLSDVVAPAEATAVYETWWFWAVVGVVVAGTAVGIGVAASGDAPLRTGDVGGVIFTLGGGR